MPKKKQKKSKHINWWFTLPDELILLTLPEKPEDRVPLLRVSQHLNHLIKGEKIYWQREIQKLIQAHASRVRFNLADEKLKNLLDQCSDLPGIYFRLKHILHRLYTNRLDSSIMDYTPLHRNYLDKQAFNWFFKILLDSTSVRPQQSLAGNTSNDETPPSTMEYYQRLDIVLKNHPKTCQKNWSVALFIGNLKLCQWLYAENPKLTFTLDDLFHALSSGNLYLIQWLETIPEFKKIIANALLEENIVKTMSNIADSGNRELFDRFYNQIPAELDSAIRNKLLTQALSAASSVGALSLITDILNKINHAEINIDTILNEKTFLGIHLAASNNHIAVLQCFIDISKDSSAFFLQHGNAILYAIGMFGHLELLNTCVEKVGVDKFSEHFTDTLLPFYTAACENNFSIVKRLLELEPDKIHEKITGGDCCAFHGGHFCINLPMLEYLWDIANTEDKLSMLRSNDYRAFRQAIYFNDLEVVIFLWGIAGPLNERKAMLAARNYEIFRMCKSLTIFDYLLSASNDELKQIVFSGISTEKLYNLIKKTVDISASSLLIKRTIARTLDLDPPQIIDTETFLSLLIFAIKTTNEALIIKLLKYTEATRTTANLLATKDYEAIRLLSQFKNNDWSLSLSELTHKKLFSTIPSWCQYHVPLAEHCFLQYKEQQVSKPQLAKFFILINNELWWQYLSLPTFPAKIRSLIAQCHFENPKARFEELWQAARWLMDNYEISAIDSERLTALFTPLAQAETDREQAIISQRQKSTLFKQSSTRPIHRRFFAALCGVEATELLNEIAINYFDLFIRLLKRVEVRSTKTHLPQANTRSLKILIHWADSLSDECPTLLSTKKVKIIQRIINNLKDKIVNEFTDSNLIINKLDQKAGS